MIIIVDAYNLLRAIPPYKATITEHERNDFVRQLAEYGRRKNHKIVLVFDGGSHTWPFKVAAKRIQIVYSGINESADDYIKGYCDSHRGQDLLLVSSDRDLNSYAARLRIPSIDSEDFHHMVAQELKTKKNNNAKHRDSEVTILHDSAEELNQLMLEASKNISIKAEDIENSSQRLNKNQLSKQERALLKKLNKL